MFFIINFLFNNNTYCVAILKHLLKFIVSSLDTMSQRYLSGELDAQIK
jgi:hypothetical protein